MPAPPPPGEAFSCCDPEEPCKECVDMDNLAKMRQEAKTRFMRDPSKLKSVKQRAMRMAKRTLLERKAMTESQITKLMDAG